MIIHKHSTLNGCAWVPFFVSYSRSASWPVRDTSKKLDHHPIWECVAIEDGIVPAELLGARKCLEGRENCFIRQSGVKFG